MNTEYLGGMPSAELIVIRAGKGDTPRAVHVMAEAARIARVSLAGVDRMTIKS